MRRDCLVFEFGMFTWLLTSCSVSCGQNIRMYSYVISLSVVKYRAWHVPAVTFSIITVSVTKIDFLPLPNSEK